jgi:RNA polymerase sigma factor (TIGR02999 family)
MDQPGDVTERLKAWRGGQEEALEELAVLVQHQLRLMAGRLIAGEQPGHGWQATELINESYLRLLGWRTIEWQNRAHFYATAARMMRHVLVDAARARRSAKRGAGAAMVSLDDAEVAAPDADLDEAALADALDALAALAPRPSQVVELRFFGGFSVEETAEALGVSVRTVINDWNTARAWLHRRLAPRSSDGH